MLPKQIKHITDHLDLLASRTSQNAGITTQLIAKGLITHVDDEILEAEFRNFGETAWAKRLYKILMRKDEEGAYEILTEILKVERQSGAVKILEELEDEQVLSGQVTADDPTQPGNGELHSIQQPQVEQEHREMPPPPTTSSIQSNEVLKEEKQARAVKIPEELEDEQVVSVRMQAVFPVQRGNQESHFIPLPQEHEHREVSTPIISSPIQVNDLSEFL